MILVLSFVSFVPALSFHLPGIVGCGLNLANVRNPRFSFVVADKSSMDGKNEKSNRNKKSKFIPSVDKQYQYVRGGFDEVVPPKTANSSISSAYAAFDSALRASSYNMFCSPLLPVDPPTPFRSKGRLQSPEPLLEREDEMKKQMEAGLLSKQYQEFDRYLSRSSESARDVKRVQGPPSVSTTAMQMAIDDISSVLPVDEADYEQLQNLLGFERMGATSRMGSALFKGNMSKHRAVSEQISVNNQMIILTKIRTGWQVQGKDRERTYVSGLACENTVTCSLKPSHQSHCFRR